MLPVVYFNNKEGEAILVAAFLVNKDAEDYVETSILSNLHIKELPLEAWSHFQSIRKKIQ